MNHANLRAAVPGEVGPASEAPHQIDELTAALAARDSFIALIGHELRNSVAPMLLLAEQFAALVHDPQATPVVASRAALLTRHMNKLVTTVERVAEIGDLRRGRLQLEPTMMDLVEVVDEVCRELRREAEAARAELVVESAGPVTGAWDRGRVKQIVSNLIFNAIRYAGGGRVEISVRERGSDVELVVRDHGPGIEPVALAHLFDRFDHDRPRRSGGFEIGLWIVKTLCAAMHGSVTVANDSSGGARFCVVLPRG
jgi:signal transduction histidine kinase